MPPLTQIPDVLLFDCFGTVFDWRSSITGALASALDGKRDQIGVNARDALNTAELAQEWRDCYKKFCHECSTNPTTAEQDFITIDSLHYTSLVDLLKRHGIPSGIFTDDEMWELSQQWHYLKPWTDSYPGMVGLRRLATASTLSNGNVNLLVDLAKSSGVTFDVIMSSEFFRVYKPNPKVYIGACALLGYAQTGGDNPAEGKRMKGIGRVAMVAAHLNDLEAAKECGLKTIYVWREGEEDYSEEEVEAIRKSDLVDLWIDKGGFIELVKQLQAMYVTVTKPMKFDVS